MIKENRTSSVKSHLTPKEYQDVKAWAWRVGLTVSDYIRHVIVNHKLPKGAINARSIGELYKVNADLARLGNLLKMAMNDDENDDKPVEELQMRIEETRQQLKSKIEEL